MPTPWGIIVAVFAFYYHHSILKSGQNKESGLLSGEKLPVIVSCFFEPLWSGLIYYLGWKNVYPNKAREAAKWAVVMFVLGIVMYVIFIMALIWFVVATGFEFE